MPADLRDTLWRAADKLRGAVDAPRYRDFVLGLVFLKYASDAYDDGDRAFLVPERARWAYLSEAARTGAAGAALDGAMAALSAANPALRGALPAVFGLGDVDPRRLADLVHLLGDARLAGRAGRPARDVLGEVYEYFLDRFARAEGRRGGEFYTPASVVRLLVEVLEPYAGRVYDPCCGSGGMFVQADRFVRGHRGERAEIAVFGQESNERTWRLARLNLAIHGIAGDLGARPADTFLADQHPGLRADHVLANPPFNVSDWARRADDPRWCHGVPPAGNANFAWLQHIAARLADRGTAGVVLANGSLSSRRSGEGAIRAAMVEADLVSCVVALPPQLFRSTQIPACVWFLDRGKDGGDGRTDRRGQVLFVDARGLGTMVGRTERALTDADVARVADAYHAWRGTASARAKGLVYADEPGFCAAATLAEIRAEEHVLMPGRYVAAAADGEDGEAEPVEDRIERLRKELAGHLEESARLDRALVDQLARLDP
jgi:type I restriction enzyme M protein